MATFERLFGADALSAQTPTQTPFRRPCLLRSMPELNVDAQNGRRATPTSRTDFHVTSNPVATNGGQGAPDDRTITLDMPARIAPRCSGLHRGSFGESPAHGAQSKQDKVRTLQAFGIGNICDMDLIPTRRRSSSRSSSRDDSPDKYKRTMIEEMRGMPLSGKGADIDLIGGRRCEGYFSTRQGRTTPKEEKTELYGISIQHQFQRRHFSAPAETRSCPWGRCDDSDAKSKSPAPRENRGLDSNRQLTRTCSWGREHFDHVARAEQYADLIGRPEHRGPREVRSLSQERARSQPPFRVEHRDLKGSLFKCSSGSIQRLQQRPWESFEFGAQPDNTTSTQPSALIAALREATQSVPVEEVWDSMLHAFETPQLYSPEIQARETPLLSSASAVTAVLTAVSSNDRKNTTPRRSGQRVSSPVPQRVGSPLKSNGRPSDSPPVNQYRNIRTPLGRNASEHSLMSASTTAETEGTAPKPHLDSFCSDSTPKAGTVPSPTSTCSPGRQSRACRTSAGQVVKRLQQEQWKAKRRAGWAS